VGRAGLLRRYGVGSILRVKGSELATLLARAAEAPGNEDAAIDAAADEILARRRRRSAGGE
jgi:hypothetical protein